MSFVFEKKVFRLGAKNIFGNIFEYIQLFTSGFMDSSRNEARENSAAPYETYSWRLSSSRRKNLCQKENTRTWEKLYHHFLDKTVLLTEERLRFVVSGHHRIRYKKLQVSVQNSIQSIVFAWITTIYISGHSTKPCINSLKLKDAPTLPVLLQVADRR